MEETTNLEEPDMMAGPLSVSTTVHNALDKMVYWSKFLAIIGYIGIGFMVIGALVMMFAGSALSAFGGAGFAGGGMVAFIYIIMAVLYYFPVSYLYRFQKRTRMALNNGDQNSLDDGMDNLGSHFKFMGVMMVVVCSIYGMMFIIGMFGMMAAGGF